MKVIDCHTHCFPDSVADKAVASLAGAYHLEPAFDGTVSGLRRAMDAAGVDISINLPVATRPEQVESINTWSAAQASDRLVAFGALHPDFPDPAAEVARMQSLGIRGIKLHPNWQRFEPDEERALRMYEAAEGKLIISFHSGEEIEKGMEILAMPERLAEVRKRFPRLTMIVAHMGGYLMWERSEKHLVGQDVYLDMSYCHPAQLPDERLVALIKSHGADRVLFGSDGPCGHAGAQLERLMSLPLSAREKAAISHENAERLLGL